VKKSLFPSQVGQEYFDEKRYDKDGKELIFLEQFKALRAKFEYQVDRQKYKVVAVTSAIAEEGKTLTSSNLAANLASVGRRKVLLIDTDLRKSDIAGMFNAPAKPGLREFLMGEVPLNKIILSSNSLGELHLIPAGERGAAPPDLLARETFRSFLQDMRSKFDVILLDTPPIIPVADTMSLQDQVDGFIQQAIEEIEKTKILGVVLNGVEMQKYKYYHRYYGDYYHKNPR